MSAAILTMKAQADWENWLERHGAQSPGVWLRLAKKGAEHPTVSYAQAVESALCFGWIDGQKRADDAHYWLQRFTPRTPKSIWSKINKAKAEALITAGRVRAAGLQEIERAKKDGRWNAAYSSASTVTVPDDFQKALNASRRANQFFAPSTVGIDTPSCFVFRPSNGRRLAPRRLPSLSRCSPRARSFTREEPAMLDTFIEMT